MAFRLHPGPGVIVLVDDDDAVRRSLAMLLESYGWSVHIYASAHQLLTSGEPPGDRFCLLLDHQMPEMTGLELLTRLRGDGHDVPVILMTGRIDGLPEIGNAARGLGVVAVLNKPIDADDLVRTLRSVLAASV